MTKNSMICAISALTAAVAQGSGLYYVPSDTQESLPTRWTAGLNAVYDDNTTPGGVSDGDKTTSLNPYVGVTFASATPQTTWDVYARLGLIYYLSQPTAMGSQSTYAQSRVGIDMTHSFNERLRFVSRNFATYELEPDYTYGFATTRQLGEYFFWQTDNSIGYRWTDRFATYTGFSLEGLDYGNAVANSDRSIWSVYNQFRYQVSPQTVLTAAYRYSQTSGGGFATASGNQYLLGGIEHRFSPNSIVIVEAGAQLRNVAQNGSSGVSPFLEASLRTQVNSQFNIRSFVRYSTEDYDTVFGNLASVVQYDSRMTLRVGFNANYELTPRITLFGGADLIRSTFRDGRRLTPPFGSVADANETLYNLAAGASVKITDMLTGTVTYNHTDSTSDLPNRQFGRNRISVGVSAEF